MRYAGNKQALAREVKEKIQRVSQYVCYTGALTWDEVSDENWKSWVAETIPKTNPKVHCENPGIARAREFQIARESAPVMPKVLVSRADHAKGAGRAIVLAPKNRGGETFCVT